MSKRLLTALDRQILNELVNRHGIEAVVKAATAMSTQTARPHGRPADAPQNCANAWAVIEFLIKYRVTKPTKTKLDDACEMLSKIMKHVLRGERATPSSAAPRHLYYEAKRRSKTEPVIRQLMDRGYEFYVESFAGDPNRWPIPLLWRARRGGRVEGPMIDTWALPDRQLIVGIINGK